MCQNAHYNINQHQIQLSSEIYVHNLFVHIYHIQCIVNAEKCDDFGISRQNDMSKSVCAVPKPNRKLINWWNAFGTLADCVILTLTWCLVSFVSNLSFHSSFVVVHRKLWLKVCTLWTSMAFIHWALAERKSNNSNKTNINTTVLSMQTKIEKVECAWSYS